jgi:hypothetical protein
MSTRPAIWITQQTTWREGTVTGYTVLANARVQGYLFKHRSKNKRWERAVKRVFALLPLFASAPVGMECYHDDAWEYRSLTPRQLSQAADYDAAWKIAVTMAEDWYKAPRKDFSLVENK